MDDLELLRHYAVTQSEASFTALAQRHLNLVYSAARRQVQVRRAGRVATNLQRAS